MEVKGRHALEGVPRTVTVTDSEIREALAEPLRQIVQAVRDSRSNAFRQSSQPISTIAALSSRAAARSCATSTGDCATKPALSGSSPRTR